MRLSIGTYSLCAAIIFGICSTSINAQSTLVQWNFNGSSTNPTTVDSHFLQTPVAKTIGVGTTQFVAAGNNGSSDSGIPNIAFQASNFPAQGTNSGTGGFEYDFDTTNYTLNSFSYDFRASGGPSGWQQLQYTTNGTTWQAIPIPNPSNSPNIVNNDFFFQSDNWTNQVGASQGTQPWDVPIDLTALGSSINNNPHFGIRQVAVFSPVAFSDSTGAHAADAAYMRADQKTADSDPGPNPISNGAQYTSTSTWRDDMVTLTGTYNPPVFTPANLTWNAASGTWDINTGNQPWHNGANPSPFHQTGGLGDNVSFNSPASGSTITIQNTGVTPNSTTISTNGTLTFTGGSIGGTGGLTKSGSGTLILDNSNTFTSVNNPTSITGGILETHFTSPLGTGPVSMSNLTWNATTNSQTSAGTITLAGPAIINTVSDLTLSGGLTGSGALTKTGSGTLGVGGINDNSGAINITGGNVRLDSTNALGGNPVSGVAGPVMTVSNAGVIFNSAGGGADGTDSRLSNNVTLTNGTISRNDLTGGVPGSSKSNADSHLTAYAADGTYANSWLTINGNSSIVNNEHRTAAAGDPGGVGATGHSNQLDIDMPVLVTSGSTLSANATNGALTVLTGATTGPTGKLSNTAVAFHGTSSLNNPNDSITLQSGATLSLIGAGEKRIGSGDTGKPIIGMGTTGSESTLKADGVTFMTDQAGAFTDTNKVNSLLVVAGSGLGGLRIEAPLNANYFATPDPLTGQIATSGLFGNNPDTSLTSAGNVYTIMSPNRYAGLSGFDGSPTQTADGAMLPALGGTLTLAATDSGIGTVDNGPAAGTAVKLGLDNTSTSGSITYTIDPAANSAAFTNFGGLVLKQTGAASVTTQLLGNATLNGANPAATTFDQSGGIFNLNGHSFTVGGAANVTNGTIMGANSSFTAGSITLTGGALAPESGPSTPGTLTLTGNTTLGHASHLSYELGTPGTIGGGVNSLTEVHGNLTIGAILDVTGLTGFGAGTYRLMDYTGSLINTTPTIGTLPSGYAANLDLSTVGQVNLQVVKFGSISGDVNGDGVVNGLDIAQIASHWLTTGAYTIGDANHDGVVNGLDISLVASNWLHSSGGGTGAGSAAAVPEPATYILCAIGAALGLACRLGKRKRRG